MTLTDSTGSNREHQLAFERVLMCFAAAAYLLLIDITIPHGDALRITRQIASLELHLNPNHLLLEPIGYAWYRLLESIGCDISVLNSFELLSGLATIGSLLLFHQALILIGVREPLVRLTLVLGLFASKNFLSMATSQYFFMIQMPFILGAACIAIKYVKDNGSATAQYLRLISMGTLMAVPTAIEINNIIPTVAIGAVLITSNPGPRRLNLSHGIAYWMASGILGVLLFLVGYAIASPEHDFFSWVLAYQGEASSSIDNYYGSEWSAKSLAVSTATATFHFLFGNVVETAGMGTVLHSLVSSQQLEFNPNYSAFVVSSTLALIAGTLVGATFLTNLLASKRELLPRLFITWILSYIAFNIFWPYSSDLFWFQILPFLWLLVALMITKIVPSWLKWSQSTKTAQSRMLGILFTFVSLTLLTNTLLTVQPLTRMDIEQNHERHLALVQNYGAEIVPGWDNYKWMMDTTNEYSGKKYLLMNMALVPEDQKEHISFLPGIVRTHLSNGQRVIVGRLFTLDRESNPWYGLSELGYSRQRIQSMLSEFCNDSVGTIDDVEFHELTSCR